MSQLTEVRKPSGGVLALALLVPVLGACGGGGDGEAREVPFREDFAECAGYELNDDVATVDCPDGELRVLVSQPQVSGTHFVPFRFDTNQQTLDVSAAARAPVAGEAWGIGCLGSERDEAPHGYLFVISSLGDAAIFRLVPASSAEESDDRVPQEFVLLKDRDDVVREASARHVLRIRCTRAADTGTLNVKASVDGEDALAANDRHDGVAPFTAAFSSVLTDKAGTDVRFDDVDVGGIEAGAPAVNDQDARIAVVTSAPRRRPPTETSPLSSVKP